jgi:hypothetical protein
MAPADFPVVGSDRLAGLSDEEVEELLLRKLESM